MLFKPYCCGHNGESSGNTYLVNCQCCYQSQDWPSIINTVVEATLPLKWTSKGFGKRKKTMASTKKHTTEHFQVMFCWCTSSASFAVKKTATVCMCVSWPILTVYLCMAYFWLGWVNMTTSRITSTLYWPLYGVNYSLLFTVQVHGFSVLNMWRRPNSIMSRYAVLQITSVAFCEVVFKRVIWYSSTMPPACSMVRRVHITLQEIIELSPRIGRKVNTRTFCTWEGAERKRRNIRWKRRNR